MLCAHGRSTFALVGNPLHLLHFKKKWYHESLTYELDVDLAITITKARYVGMIRGFQCSYIINVTCLDRRVFSS